MSADGTPPWRVLGSRVLVRDRWIDLRADRCVTARGIELDPFYVLGYADWVNAVALTPEGLVVTVRQYRHGIGRPVLELPGGAVDGGEVPALAGARELVEETGYAGAAPRHVCSFPVNPATHTNLIHTCLILDARPAAPLARDPGEDMTVHLLEPAALLDEMRAGRFGQSMQVGPFLLALEAAGRLGPGLRPG